jgi:hypothetical protein
MALLTTTTTTANVVVKSVNGTLQSTGRVNPVTLVSAGTSVSRFDQLADVIEGTPSNGDVVTYNAALDKYEVKAISNVEITVDGGTF